MSTKLSFGGCVFDDINGDGIVLTQDANGLYTNTEEPGLAGVTVRVVDANGTEVLFINNQNELVSSVTTDSQGIYRIFGLTEGDEYKIQFDYSNLIDVGNRIISPSNVVVPQFIGQGGSDGKDSDAVDNLSSTVAETALLTVGQSGTTKVNLGLITEAPAPRHGVIGNQVFEDLNGNGLKDGGEVGIAGVNVTLTGAGDDGLLGTADDTTHTTTTSEKGNYRFGRLAAGDYKVTFEQPTGFEFTQANAGNDNRDSDADVDTGMTGVISLAANERNNTIDAGLIRPGSNTDPKTAIIGNKVFEDIDGNGLKSGSEGGVANVSVTLTGTGDDGLFDTADDITKNTITSANGNYRFAHLAAGDYKVTFDQPTGFEFTQANAGNDNRDSDADVNTGMTGVISLAVGERNNSIDAGLVRRNNAPIASDDQQTTPFNTPTSISVLGNDTDADGDALSITSIDGQSVAIGESVDVGEGVAILLANGQIAFNPADNFSGDKTFSYHVSDGNGGEDIANVTVTVEPRPRKSIHASIVGAGGINEGKSSHYKVQLDHAVTEDTVFTLDVHDGSATRVDRNDYQAAHQDIMWGGYYSVGYVDYYGNWIKRAYYVDNRVANGTSLSSGDRPQVGPDGYTTWDYTVEKNGHVQNNGKVNVLVSAGETMSEAFEVQTWKEKVTVDNAPWSVNTGYYEGTENFSIKLTGTTGNNLDDFELGNNKTVDIFDKTHYAFVSPIALDLNGDGVQTTALGDTTGTFDLRGDGSQIESGWLSSEDAFLVVDSNGNGTIDDISEMFGGDVGDGFAKLATYDTNGDGLIDESELLGGGLALWRDGNSNHRTDAGELISLGSQGITSLDTAFVETPVYQNGNVLIEHGSATKADGTKVDLVDAYFQVADTSAIAQPTPENAAL